MEQTLLEGDAGQSRPNRDSGCGDTKKYLVISKQKKRKYQ